MQFKELEKGSKAIFSPKEKSKFCVPTRVRVYNNNIIIVAVRALKF